MSWASLYAIAIGGKDKLNLTDGENGIWIIVAQWLICSVNLFMFTLGLK